MAENTVSYSGSIVRAAPTVLAASVAANGLTELAMAHVGGSKYVTETALRGSTFRNVTSLFNLPGMIWRANDVIVRNFTPSPFIQPGTEAVFKKAYDLYTSLQMRNTILRCSLFLGALVAGGVLIAAASRVIDSSNPENAYHKNLADVGTVVFASIITACSVAILGITGIRNPVAGLLIPIAVYGAMSAFGKNQFNPPLELQARYPLHSYYPANYDPVQKKYRTTR